MRILILLGLNILSLCASQNVESSWYFPRSSAMLRNKVPLLTTLIVSNFELLRSPKLEGYAFANFGEPSGISTSFAPLETILLTFTKYFSKHPILWNFCKEP